MLNLVCFFNYYNLIFKQQCSKFIYKCFIEDAVKEEYRMLEITKRGLEEGLLGVIISDDLKWNAHVEYVIAKAAKTLYTLRLLKRAGVMPEDMLNAYTYNIRSVLEYAAQAWQDIPAYLSDAIESIQKRALRIIFLNLSYQQALD